jgi:hypothetical protein
MVVVFLYPIRGPPSIKKVGLSLVSDAAEGDVCAAPLHLTRWSSNGLGRPSLKRVMGVRAPSTGPSPSQVFFKDRFGLFQ